MKWISRKLKTDKGNDGTKKEPVKKRSVFDTAVDLPSDVKEILEPMRECTKCALHKGRTNVVVGRGTVGGSTVMIVGGAPNEAEDHVGMPFVGKAGELLDDLMVRAGLHKFTLYMTTVIKCRPRQKPTRSQIETCVDHLQVQIKVVNPLIIVAVGELALNYFYPKIKSIANARGKMIRDSKRTGGKPLYVIVSPNTALRDEKWLDIILQDCKHLREEIRVLEHSSAVFSARKIG